jgi:hypothetical protein
VRAARGRTGVGPSSHVLLPGRRACLGVGALARAPRRAGVLGCRCQGRGGPDRHPHPLAGVHASAGPLACVVALVLRRAPLGSLSFGFAVLRWVWVVGAFPGGGGRGVERLVSRHTALLWPSCLAPRMLLSAGCACLPFSGPLCAPRYAPPCAGHLSSFAWGALGPQVARLLLVEQSWELPPTGSEPAAMPQPRVTIINQFSIIGFLALVPCLVSCCPCQPGAWVSPGALVLLPRGRARNFSLVQSPLRCRSHVLPSIIISFKQPSSIFGRLVHVASLLLFPALCLVNPVPG